MDPIRPNPMRGIPADMFRAIPIWPNDCRGTTEAPRIPIPVDEESDFPILADRTVLVAVPLFIWIRELSLIRPRVI